MATLLKLVLDPGRHPLPFELDRPRFLPVEVVKRPLHRQILSDVCIVYILFATTHWTPLDHGISCAVKQIHLLTKSSKRLCTQARVIPSTCTLFRGCLDPTYIAAFSQKSFKSACAMDGRIPVQYAAALRLGESDWTC